MEIPDDPNDGEILRAVKAMARRKLAVVPEGSMWRTHDEAKLQYVGLGINTEEYEEQVAPTLAQTVVRALNESAAQDVDIVAVVCGFWLDGYATGLITADERQRSKPQQGWVELDGMTAGMARAVANALDRHADEQIDGERPLDDPNVESEDLIALARTLRTKAGRR